MGATPIHPRNVAGAAAGSLHRSQGQALNQVTLQRGEHDRDRDGGEQGRGHDLVPFHGVAPGHQVHDLERQRQRRLVAEHRQRHGELVPARDEGDDAGHGEGGDAEREEDADRGAEAGGAVDPGGLLQFGGDRREVGGQHPDGEGQVEPGVDDDHAGPGIDQRAAADMDGGGHAEQAQHQQDRGEHLRDQQELGIGALAAEGQPAHGVGGGEGDQQGQDRAAHADGEAVQQAGAEIDGLPHVGEVFPCQAGGQPARREGEHLVARLERGGEHDGEREHRQHQQRGQDQPAPERAGGHAPVHAMASSRRRRM